MKKIIYYFTGTGNSLRAAKVIGQSLGETQLISMKSNPTDVPATDCEVVGFVFPVYHWTLPVPVVKFVESLQINPKAYVFAIAMPSFICGISCELLADILQRKGVTINYGNRVNSVANYVIVYPPFPFPKLRVPQTERKLKRIAKDIVAKKSRNYPHSNWFIKKRRDKIMTPYLDLQKYADYPFTISSDCLHCGLCSQVCPCHNIEMQNGTPTFLHHCAQCMACVASCPKRAIGYNITSNDKQLLNASSSSTPLAKIMCLPPKRKIYRNPFISVQELTKSSIIVKKDNCDGEK